MEIANYLFAEPWWFLLLLLLPLGWWWLRRRGDRSVSVRLPRAGTDPLPTTWRTRVRPWLEWLSVLAAVLLVVALARPQRVFEEEKINSEGIDIMLVLDLSNSMLAEDFKPNRLEVAKAVAADFVSNRPYDRIGLSLFAEVAYTPTALTTDHRVLVQKIQELQIGQLPERGTAIGMGLMSALNRLDDSESESKVVILLTDGVNNSGYVDPLLAAETAEKIGATVYTIGVGSTGRAYTPDTQLNNGLFNYTLQNVEIDEVTLQKIADRTGGKYFRATDEQGLAQIYAQIDELEKTEIEVTTIRRETDLFYWFAAVAVGLLLLQLLLAWTVLRSVV